VKVRVSSIYISEVAIHVRLAHKSIIRRICLEGHTCSIAFSSLIFKHDLNIETAVVGQLIDDETKTDCRLFFSVVYVLYVFHKIFPRIELHHGEIDRFSTNAIKYLSSFLISEVVESTSICHEVVQSLLFVYFVFVFE